MSEIWKDLDIDMFKDKYQVSNNGHIKNKETGKIVSEHVRNGYKAVSLNKSGKQKTFNVHSLVGMTFLKVEKGKVINHKNGIMTDNMSENLECITYKENTQHAIKTGLQKTHPVKVNQYDLQDNFIKQFASILEASDDTGANDRHISAVCRGKRKTTGGFKWKYVNETVIENINIKDGKTIKEFPNYIVFENGTVYSIKYKRILKPKILPSGYHSIKLCNDGHMRDYYIHVLVANAYLPIDETRPFVNHIDSNKSNNKLTNLEFVSHSENMIHYFKSKKK